MQAKWFNSEDAAWSRNQICPEQAASRFMHEPSPCIRAVVTETEVAEFSRDGTQMRCFEAQENTCDRIPKEDGAIEMQGIVARHRYSKISLCGRLSKKPMRTLD